MSERLTRRPKVAVVVASVDAARTARESLGRFVEEADDSGEVVLVDASHDGTADLVAGSFPRARILRRDRGLLVPELWRDGLLATDAPLVVFSTAAMVPSRGWLSALLNRLEATTDVAVGGPIEPGDGLSPVDRAVYLMRYVGYLSPLTRACEAALPGENAVYRRDRLDALEATLATGFWEVDVQRKLRERGEGLGMATRASITFRGGCGLFAMLGQRFRHGVRYGASRAKRWKPSERVARSAAAPLVPFLLMMRAFLGLHRRGRSILPWIVAVPALLAFLSAWAVGELVGTWIAPGRAAGKSQGQPRGDMRWTA
jgi:hypothetical protein